MCLPRINIGYLEQQLAVLARARQHVRNKGRGVHRLYLDGLRFAVVDLLHQHLSRSGPAVAQSYIHWRFISDRVGRAIRARQGVGAGCNFTRKRDVLERVDGHSVLRAGQLDAHDLAGAVRADRQSGSVAKYLQFLISRRHVHVHAIGGVPNLRVPGVGVTDGSGGEFMGPARFGVVEVVLVAQIVDE